jgi:hypothetical protein
MDLARQLLLVYCNQLPTVCHWTWNPHTAPHCGLVHLLQWAQQNEEGTGRIQIKDEFRRSIVIHDAREEVEESLRLVGLEMIFSSQLYNTH